MQEQSPDSDSPFPVRKFGAMGLYKKVIYKVNKETVKTVGVASLQSSFPTD